MSHDVPPSDDDLYAKFQILRDHVVEVAHDFVERVAERIRTMEHDERFSAPSLGSVFLSGASQLLNLVQDVVPEAPKEDEPGHEPE